MEVGNSKLEISFDFFQLTPRKQTFFRTGLGLGEVAKLDLPRDDLAEAALQPAKPGPAGPFPSLVTDDDAMFCPCLLSSGQKLVLTAFVLTMFSAVGQSVSADDWPQWMGPGRDNVWRETGLIKSFPKKGLPKVWTAPVAGGYAGPAVAGGKVFVTDYTNADSLKKDNFQRGEFSGTERVFCLNEETGKEIWSYEYPVKYDISYPSGPRCTPLIEGDRVYTLGAMGNLFCFNSADGAVIWQKPLIEAYKTKAPLWGYSAHPLIDGDKLLTLAGGAGSHIVALNKMTGDEIWRSQTQTEQGYVPPQIFEIAGVRQLLAVGPEAVNSLDPETGERLWTVPYKADNGSIIHTPVLVGKHMFVGGFQNRNLMIELNEAKPGAKALWSDKKNFGMSPVNVQPIAVDGVIYGFDASGELMAVDVPSGRRLWTSTKPLAGGRKQGSGTAFIVKNDDRFWLFNESGDLLIAELNKKGYKEIDRTNILEPTNSAFGRDVVWCMPAFANKRLYVRNDKEIVCVDLGAK